MANQLTLKLGDYPRLSGWAECNHKSPSKWKKTMEERVSERCN